MAEEELNSTQEITQPDSLPAADMAIAQEISELIRHMLGDGRSIIDPTATIWTTESATDLRARIGDNPLIGTDEGQWEKLDRQLEGAPREVVLLAAELVFLREHPLRSARPETRLAHVNRVLEHLDDPLQIPETMSSWLARPAGTAGLEPGSWYNGHMWRHIIWASTFIIHWNQLTDSDKEAARNDPWRLQQTMLDAGDDRSDIRNLLQFLARPDYFEPISSTRMKTQIRDGLAERIQGASGSTPIALDRDILAIRRVLARDIEGTFHFWTPGVVELWDPSQSQPEITDTETPELSEPRPRHYWIYSPGQQASEWDEFSSNDLMAIGWDKLTDLSTYPNREAIRKSLDIENTGQSMKNATLAIWQFQNEIAVGDIVYAKRGRREIIGRGEVTSDARYDPNRKSFHHLRSVNWTHQGSWEHPGNATVKTLTDITTDPDYVEKLEDLITGEVEPDLPVQPSPVPAYSKEKFLSEVYLPEEKYDRLRSLLMRKKNVILAGPPGVGKTFAAKRLAYSIIGAQDPSRVQTVQFHQSFSYEDFMMGYRPTETGGFALAEGPFHRFCEIARAEDEDKPYFFIIDEINRGNISKIFGELLMLIEADKRGQELRLLYKNEKFSVPPNVHIIGMMNTADRSLAVLDYALRRRFGFFEMTPGFNSAGFALRQRNADSPTLDRVVETIIQLNSAIADDPALGQGFAIGHSYLTKPKNSDDDDAWLVSVIEDELIPLLDEYWFDEPDKAKEWAGRLRAAVK